MGFDLGSQEVVCREDESANNHGEAKSVGTGALRLKPLGFVDTRTLFEIT